MYVENTCFQCGQPIKVGENVYAENQAQVTAGLGICQRDFKAAKRAAMPAEEPKPEPKAEPKKRSRKKKTAPK